MICGDRKGLSSVVAITLIILGTFIGVTLLWAFVVRSVDRGGEIVDPDCLTIDIDIVSCRTYGACGYFSGISYYEADVILKRDVGKGNITGLRFVFENQFGRTGSYDRNLKTNFRELETISFNNSESIPVQGGFPKLLKIVALIGKNKDVCPVTTNVVNCPALTGLLPFGYVVDHNSNRQGNCCQWPTNSSECYDGNDPNYPIDSNTKQLIDGKLPPGKKTVCCQYDPQTGGSS